MCEYKSGTAPVTMGEAVAGGSHLRIICARLFAFLVTSAQLGSIIKCVCMIVGIVSMNFSIFACLSCFNILPYVATKSMCSST